jgi:hypothetical protein
MNDLVLTGGQAVATLARQHAPAFAAVDPNWGIGIGSRFDAMPEAAVVLPPLDLAEAIRDELQAALVPCSTVEAAKAAQRLVDSYPQRDATTGAYSEELTMRFARCPADLLPCVIRRLLDDAIEFRPAPGLVKRSVDQVVGKRRRLLLSVEAVLRVHALRAKAAERDAGRDARVSALPSPPPLRMPGSEPEDEGGPASRRGFARPVAESDPRLYRPAKTPRRAA